MNLYDFQYKKDVGLLVRIDKEELAELMKDDQKENARLEDLDYQQECQESRTFEEQEKFDSGMCESDFM